MKIPRQVLLELQANLRHEEMWDSSVFSIAMRGPQNEDGERLMHGVRLFGQAALLLLKGLGLHRPQLPVGASPQPRARQSLRQSRFPPPEGSAVTLCTFTLLRGSSRRQWLELHDMPALIFRQRRAMGRISHHVYPICHSHLRIPVRVQHLGQGAGRIGLEMA